MAQAGAYQTATFGNFSQVSRPAGSPNVPGSGCSQSAPSSVLGKNSTATPAVNWQGLGLPVVSGANAYVPWDGSIP